MSEETRERPRITSSGPDYIKITGLTRDEVELIEGALNGVRWIRAVDGKLETREVYKQLPDPVDDPLMVDYWSRAEPGTRTDPEYKIVKFDEPHKHDNQSIYIQSLHGYGGEEAYRFNADRLESYGFIPMRSKRSESGKYWEIWYLPGPWHAKGALKEFLEGIKGEKLDERETTERMITFLCHRGSFGSLDASVQRAALSMYD